MKLEDYLKMKVTMLNTTITMDSLWEQFTMQNYNAEKNAQEMHSKYIDKFIENEKKVYNTILNNNYATTNDIASITGLANRTIANIIKKLKEQNIIKRIGPDKGGHWEVKE